MIGWIKCHVLGVHNYSVCCGRGMVRLECDRCGRRSCGWAVHPHQRDRPAGPVEPRRRSAFPSAASLIALVEILKLRG